MKKTTGFLCFVCNFEQKHRLLLYFPTSEVLFVSCVRKYSKILKRVRLNKTKKHSKQM